MSVKRIKKELAIFARIGLPIAVTQLAHNGISVADTLMSGQVSAIDLAGVAVGSSIWVPVFLFMAGVIVATTALVSHAYGAGRTQDIVSITRQSFWLAAILAALAFSICRWNGFYLGWLDIEPEVRSVAQGYLEGISWGVPAIAAYQVLRCYCEAQTDTRSIMILTLVSLAINIPANYVFIFGGAGIPAMGGAGAGYASAVAMWAGLVMILLYTGFHPRYRPHQLFSSLAWPVRKQVQDLARLGVPIGLAVFFEAALFCAASLAIAPFGAITLASHQIVISITSFTFMIPLSIAMATTVRVGNLLGQEQYSQARFSSFCAVGLGLTFACFTASVMILLPELVTGWYTNNAQVQQMAAGILMIAALFQFSDGIQVTSSGALRAYKDTRVVMLVTLVAYWIIGFPTALFLGYYGPFEWMSGARGFWLGLVVGLTVAAVLLFRRLLRISARAVLPQGAPSQQNVSEL